MDKIKQILSIAAKLRSGLNDSLAPDKLMAEKQELLVEVADGSLIAASTEAADIAYFAVKSMDWAARQVGVDIETLLDLVIAKYGLRAQPGNPKNKVAEAVAVAAILATVESAAWCDRCNLLAEHCRENHDGRVYAEGCAP